MLTYRPALLLVGLMSILGLRAQGLDGTWQGALEAGGAKLRLILHVSKSADGLYLGSLDSVDQGSTIPINRIQVTGNSVHLELNAIGGAFEGTLNGEKLTGTWSQAGNSLPLEFARSAAPAEAPKPTAPAARPFGIPVDLAVPIAPTPFSGGGKTHLVYELHITNFSSGELLLKRIDVLGETGVLLSLEATQLNGLLARPGVMVSDKRSLGPGLRAVAYLWITIDAGARVPGNLRHRITADDQSVEGGVVTVSAAKPIALGPPLRGSDWLAANGPANDSGHRRALIPVEGNARIAQRFAIDWVQMRPDGKTFQGDPKDNKNYRAYGNDVLAVADGVVAATKDGIPENIPGENSRAVPITLETVGGNHVILDLGGGHFAFYAHLQPGSLKVKVGDRVRRGQVLGLLGNSGNSTEPHLHFHVSNGASPLGSEGLPYLLESFEVVGGPSPGPRQNQMPLKDTRIRFAESR